jgi:hypothetical protein
MEWASPKSILRHCPGLKKPRGTQTPDTSSAPNNKTARARAEKQYTGLTDYARATKDEAETIRWGQRFRALAREFGAIDDEPNVDAARKLYADAIQREFKANKFDRAREMVDLIDKVLKLQVPELTRMKEYQGVVRVNLFGGPAKKAKAKDKTEAVSNEVVGDLGKALARVGINFGGVGLAPSERKRKTRGKA